MIWEELVSDSVRKYWEGINFVPTDEMKIMLIACSPIPYWREQEALKEIRDNTDIESIKIKLDEAIGYSENAVEGFRKNDNPAVVYRTDIYEFGRLKEATETGLFSSYNLAYSFALDYLSRYKKCDFGITKTVIFNERSDVEKMDLHGESIDFDGDGKIKRLNTRQEYTEWFHSIAFAYYDIPHPFKKGDVVRKIASRHRLWEEDDDEQDIIYIVEGEVYNSLAGHDSSDIGMCVESFDTISGRLYIVDQPEPAYAYDYAGIDFTTNTWDEPVSIILFGITEMMRGNIGISFQTMQDAFRCLRERAEENYKDGCFQSGLNVRSPYYRWPVS